MEIKECQMNKPNVNNQSGQILDIKGLNRTGGKVLFDCADTNNGCNNEREGGVPLRCDEASPSYPQPYTDIPKT